MSPLMVNQLNQLWNKQVTTPQFGKRPVVYSAGNLQTPFISNQTHTQPQRKLYYQV